MAKTKTEGTTTGKVISLTFTTEAEVAFYERLKAGAEADDRSVASFTLRYLLGKEQLPHVDAEE